MKAASQLQKSQSLLPGQSTLPSSTNISEDLLVMELSSSSPLIRLRKLQIYSPSPWESRISVSCGISLWVGDSIGIPIGYDVNATQQIMYPFPVYYHCIFRGSVIISRTSFKSSLKLIFAVGNLVR